MSDRVREDKIIVHFNFVTTMYMYIYILLDFNKHAFRDY